MNKVIRNVTYLNVILFISLASAVYSQDKPRMAVIPFSGVGVSEIEAVTASSLFETALVQTEEFVVIEQNQIEEILNAQAFTLTGCTDENCAVEIGKLLAAEKIVLGTLSSVGTGFVLNAKIIDVTLGQNLKAEKVVFTSMDKLPDSADDLAYKLAGLKQTEKASATAYSDELRKDTYAVFLTTQEELESRYTTISEDDISIFPSEVEEHLKTMIDSKYTFADLESRADKLLTKSRKKKAEYDRITEKNRLNNEIAYFEKKLSKEKKAAKRRKVLKYVFTGAGIASVGAAYYCKEKSDEAYDNYAKSIFKEDIEKHTEDTQTYDKLWIIYITTGDIFLITSAIMWFKKDKTNDFQNKIITLKSKLSTLEEKQ